MTERGFPARLPSGNPRRLEWEYDVFVQRLRKAQSAYERISEKGGPDAEFEVPWVHGRLGPLNHDTPAGRASMEFAIVMSRFILPDEPLNIDEVFSMMENLSDSNKMRVWLKKTRARLAKIENAPPRIARADNTPLTAREIFVDLSEKIIFTDDVAAHDFAERVLSNSELGQAVWEKFHTYAVEVYNALLEADALIRDQGFYPPRIERERHCIYCETTDGEFKSIEHTIPAALDNEYSFLPRGYVCDDCNATFAELEDAFVNSLPMSLLRVHATKLNRAGRLPVARFANIHMEKTSPNTMSTTGYAGKSSRVDPTPLPDGGYDLNFPEVASKVDHPTVGRVLFKIALNVIALEEGREAALDPRYDDARHFALHGGTFPNRFYILQGPPSAAMDVRWSRHDDLGTAFIITLMGANFVFNIEPKAKVTPPPQIAESAVLFDLSTKEPGPHPLVEEE